MPAYQKTRLNETEYEYVNEFIAHLKKGPFIHDYQGLLAGNDSLIIETVQVAKFHADAEFRGTLATPSELGVSMIYPSLWGMDAFWQQRITSEDVQKGWIPFLGSREGELRCPEKAVLLINGFVDPNVGTPPRVDAVRFRLKGKEWPPLYMGDLPRRDHGDFNVYHLEAPILLASGDPYYIEKHAIAPGVDRLRPAGLIFARGELLYKIWADRGVYD